jgi:hypothetical protein
LLLALAPVEAAFLDAGFDALLEREVDLVADRFDAEDRDDADFDDADLDEDDFFDDADFDDRLDAARPLDADLARDDFAAVDFRAVAGFSADAGFAAVVSVELLADGSDVEAPRLAGGMLSCSLWAGTGRAQPYNDSRPSRRSRGMGQSGHSLTTRRR